MKLKQRFAECIEEIDFNKIERCMKLLWRTWWAMYAWTQEHYPNHSEMIECCERLFDSAKKNYKECWKESYSSSGWFKVIVDKWYVAVEFVLEERQSF